MAETRPAEEEAGTGVDAALQDLHEVLRHQATTIAELHSALTATRRELEALQRDLDTARHIADARLRELEPTRASLQEAQQSLVALQQTKLYRWSLLPRKLYGRARRELGRHGPG